MLFFSKVLSNFHKGFLALFQLGTDETNDKGERQREEETVEGNSEKVTDADKNYWMMDLIHTFSEFTLTPWDTVWDKNIIEFFNIIAFIREYKRREAEQIKKMQKQNNVKQ